MRCPECQAKNPHDATSCSGCGLILFKLAAPSRRSEDLAQVKRRASDSSKQQCPECGGEVDSKAARCVHCSHILRDEVHQKVMARRRAQINYASWVAYIFGLLVFLIFRPVGLISIAAGLMLSIIYYAIPVSSDAPQKDWKAFFRRQFSPERVSIPFPHFGKKKLVFIGTPIVAALAGYVVNFAILQRPMNEILHQNASFHGMSVSTHYEYWVVPGVVVYDLKSADKEHDPIVVHTALLEFASKVRQQHFKRVELQYRGQARLSIEGSAFSKLGAEYARRNFRFGLFDFPRLVRGAENQDLKLSRDSSDALLQLHKIWYAEEERRAANPPAQSGV